MEQKGNAPSEIGADRKALESLIEAALDAGRDPRPGRAQRADGWTPERIRTFLDALARGEGVSAAAAAAGMVAWSAYRLRRRAGAFARAWDAAQDFANPPPAGPFVSRVLHGFVEPIMRNGQACGERHRFDNRHTMAVLTRLDRKVEERTEDKAAIRIVAESFDEFVDIVCSGDAEAAAAFIDARRRDDRLWRP